MLSSTDDLQLLVAVVEAGSFRLAADRLGLDSSVVSRGIKRLESRLDTILLHRTTRRLALTTEGQLFYEQASRILADLAAAEDSLRAQHRNPQGVLRVDAATPFILHRLVPLIGEFRRRYPGIELHLESSEGFINLLERQVDVAIRIGQLPDSSLHAQLLGHSRVRILAAPAYLARCGVPATPEALAGHAILGFLGADVLNEWPLFWQGDVRYAVQPALRASSGETLRQLALAGEGLVCLSDFMTRDDQQAGRLQEVLADCNSGLRRPVNAVFYSDSARNPRLRVWLDFLREQFAGGTEL
ncbi:LysR substrate-binding domain-containing protein [Chitinilyticum aquatile]|uniref:LysR substrate-binding domain-containing protein n=1 Tax=Chitinilyticum aquatile TaxID=362520 RepID=UPI0003FB6ADB|nr:LysR substrate-binding domain-containing protein [Chitinilyticum aquatile]